VRRPGHKARIKELYLKRHFRKITKKWLKDAARDPEVLLPLRIADVG